MQHIKCKVVVISISQPLLIGIYVENNLIETISKDGKTSDVLPSIINDLLNKYTINELYYVNNPGSYMAIKIAYVFLKTISIVNNIPLFAVSGFDFNNNSPIKALGKKYFFRVLNENNKYEIVLKFLEENEIEEFKLPKQFKNIIFTTDTLPEYNLPAV